MDIRSLLEANNSKLLQVYKENYSATIALQQTLLEAVLPHIEDELQLDSNAVQWAKERLEDTTSIFHSYKRHKFTRSFAMESIRQNLVWRINNIYPKIGGPPLKLLHCLPCAVTDPFKRPIIVLKISDLGVDNGTEDFKTLLMPTIDRLQAHLKRLNGPGECKEPVSQYIVLLDLAGVSMQSVDVNLITWAMRDVIPRFPGMIAAVFMLNYSWTHQGLWTVTKRVLPASALSRIFFPSKKELEGYFTLSCLPQEYGGTLPCLEDLDDPLRPKLIDTHNDSGCPPLLLPPSPLDPAARVLTRISATPFHNPYYGYPTSHYPTQATHLYQPDRRRMRDLLSTLAVMWWARWKVHANVLLWSMLAIVAARVWVKRGVRISTALIAWKKLWATGLG